MLKADGLSKLPETAQNSRTTAISMDSCETEHRPVASMPEEYWQNFFPAALCAHTTSYTMGDAFPDLAEAAAPVSSALFGAEGLLRCFWHVSDAWHVMTASVNRQSAAVAMPCAAGGSQHAVPRCLQQHKQTLALCFHLFQLAVKHAHNCDCKKPT